MDEKMIEVIKQGFDIYKMNFQKGDTMVVTFKPDVVGPAEIRPFLNGLSQMYPDLLIFAIPDEYMEMEKWSKQALKNFMKSLQKMIEEKGYDSNEE